MVARQVPSNAILLDAEAVTSDVPTQHLPPPPAFHTHDIIAANGSADRNCRGPLAGRFCQRFAESPERLIDGRDQGRKLL